MNLFLQNAKKYTDPEKMASDFLNIYFRNREISYPFNPFQMLSDMGIAFSMRPFHKLEGVYMPANGADDLAVVGINLDRPITRQRYTAAHELCHHLRDSNNRCICTPNAQDRIEKFAEGFAAAVLMPLKELNRQVSIRSVNGYVDFDGVLEIAQYFGVSFESCLYRIAYKLKAIDGDTKYPALKKRIRTYKVKEKRADRGFNDLELYEGLIDACSGFLSFTPNDYARFVFQNHYIYNDSRMEGVNTDQETAAEIVTDLRLNQQNSPYCIEENEAYLSIAGHYAMYQEILKDPVKDTCSVYDTIDLNRKLFSCYPHPEFGGNFRQDDTLVLGAKFETVPHQEVAMEMYKADLELQQVFPNRKEMALSSYIEAAIRFHHRLTVIHPYADGNGRTLRAFLNVMLVRAGITPLYIKVEEKKDYLAALEKADLERNYVPLYIFMFQLILRRCAELCS